MDLLSEYVSDSESSSNTSDGNECGTVNADKDLNAGAVRQVYLVTYRTCERVYLVTYV